MFGFKFKLVTINVDAFEEVVRERLHIEDVDLDATLNDILAKLRAIELPKKIVGFRQFVDSTLAIKRSVEKVVVLVEQISDAMSEDDTMTSEKKKDLAVEMLDGLFEFPMVLEMADETIFSLLISFVVDELDTRFGKTWGHEVTKGIVAR